MLGKVLSVATALLWAASTILSAETLKDMDPLSANALKTLFSAISMLSIAFAIGEMLDNIQAEFPRVTLRDPCSDHRVWFGGHMPSQEHISDRCFKVLHDRVYFPLFTMVLATVLLGEPFLLQYLVGTVIIFFGIMLVSVNDNNEGPRRSYRELLAAFASALLWSIGMIFIAVGLEDVSVISANTIRFPFLFVFLFAVSRLWKRKLNLSRRNLALLGTSGILGMTLAGMTFLYSIQFIGVSRATPLSSSSPVWASLMSSIFLKEKLTWRVIASSIVVGAGRYLLT